VFGRWYAQWQDQRRSRALARLPADTTGTGTQVAIAGRASGDPEATSGGTAATHEDRRL
jgi:hypothetical protein